VILNWRTETENNNFGFEIEKSISGSDFFKIGFVAGKGNSAQTEHYSFIDKNPGSGALFYRLKQIDRNGRFEYSSIVRIEMATPSTLELKQNYPNPFNPVTQIVFKLPSTGSLNEQKLFTNLAIFDVKGRKVKTLVNEEKAPGIYSVTWDGTNELGERVASGVYFYRIRFGSFSQSKKMILLE
jgi:hypothetical protein